MIDVLLRKGRYTRDAKEGKAIWRQGSQEITLQAKKPKKKTHAKLILDF